MTISDKSTSQVLADRPQNQGEQAENDRHHRIAEAAYFKSERRGFAPGYDLDDWREAEQEIDAASASRQGERSEGA